jgi:hypothetical protein
MHACVNNFIMAQTQTQTQIQTQLHANIFANSNLFRLILLIVTTSMNLLSGSLKWSWSGGGIAAILSVGVGRVFYSRVAEVGRKDGSNTSLFS